MLIIGCGNRDCGDDGAGIWVAQRLRALGFEAQICSGQAFDLIEAWKGADNVAVVDSTVSGACAGKVSVWDGGPASFQEHLPRSTHGFGVAEAIKLARVLNRLPRRLRVFGIEGRCFDCGIEVSPEVMYAVEQVVERIKAEMAAF
jgi:hydrogenase maturation protease